MVEGAPKIGEAAESLMKMIWDTITNTDWLSLGANIIKGIISGITSQTSALFDTLTGLAKKALDAAKNVLGIHSPSAVFKDEIGQYIDLGIAEGIDDYANPIQSAMGRLSDMTQSGFSMATQAISAGSERQPELAMAGYGDLTIPVYIGNQKFGQAVINANQLSNYRSGGR